MHILLHRHHQARRTVYNRTTHRLREIERIIRHRYFFVPDTDDAGIFLEQVAQCLLHLRWKKTRQRLDFAELLDLLNIWCVAFAPDVSMLLRRDAVRDALRRSQLDRADECAASLRVSYEERTELRLTTIGACDISKRERTKKYKARKRQRDRERVARKRAERGTVPRIEYEANSLAKKAPWKALGISRATWFRRRETGPSPTNSYASMLGDILVSRATAAPFWHNFFFGDPIHFGPPIPNETADDKPSVPNAAFLATPSRQASFLAAVEIARTTEPARRGQRTAHAAPRTHADDAFEAEEQG
jgi:hypothetical protein